MERAGQRVYGFRNSVLPGEPCQAQLHIKVSALGLSKKAERQGRACRRGWCIRDRNTWATWGTFTSSGLPAAGGFCDAPFATLKVSKGTRTVCACAGGMRTVLSKESTSGRASRVQTQEERLFREVGRLQERLLMVRDGVISLFLRLFLEGEGDLSGTPGTKLHSSFNG
jgi:hypothetical protein